MMIPNTEQVYCSLTLTEITRSGRPHPGREEPFSLIFTGPSEIPLGQDTFLLRNETLGENLIFLVPVGESNGTRTYQSVFN